MTSKRTNTINVDRGSVEDLPTSLEELIDFLIDMLAKVPPEHTSNVKLDFESYSEDDEGYCNFHVYYNRQETDEEVAERQKREAEIVERNERRRIEREQEELRRLAALHPEAISTFIIQTTT